MRENKGFFSFAFDSAHLMYGVWTWPKGPVIALPPALVKSGVIPLSKTSGHTWEIKIESKSREETNWAHLLWRTDTFSTIWCYHKPFSRSVYTDWCRKKVERFVFSFRARLVRSANSRLIGSSRNQRNLLCSVNFDLLIENECKWALHTLFLKSCNANIIAWITLLPPWFSLHTMKNKKFLIKQSMK